MEGEFNHEHAKDPRKLYLLAEARFKPKQRPKTEGKSNKSNRKTRARIKNAVSRSRRLKMIYFALNADGRLFNLGDCKDFEQTLEISDNFGIEPVWVFNADTAKEYATFINQELNA